jgi:hypothetical protein
MCRDVLLDLAFSVKSYVGQRRLQSLPNGLERGRRHRQWRKHLLSPYRIQALDALQVALRGGYLLVHVYVGCESHELADRHPGHHAVGDLLLELLHGIGGRAPSLSEVANLVDQLHGPLAQRDVGQVLPVFRSDLIPSVYVAPYKRGVEDKERRAGALPNAVLKAELVAVHQEIHGTRIGLAKGLPLQHSRRIACGKGTQDG